MKKIIAIMAALSVFMISSAFAAENVQVFNGYELPADTEVSVDLDYDGNDETVSWTSVYDEENYIEEVALKIASAGGGSLEWVEYLYGARVYITNIDSNGPCEVFLTGDQMSDDYITYCLQYVGGSLMPLMFADAMRGENTGGYYEYGYGMVTDISENALTLCGSQDVLGTYFGSRVYGLGNGRFELADDGLWRFDVDVNDPDMWEYRALTLLNELPVIFTENGGEQQGVLNAGDKLIVTASDKVSIVYFTVRDGRQGYFLIQPDVMNWGSLVNGMSESEMFEYVPYAD